MTSLKQQNEQPLKILLLIAVVPLYLSIMSMYGKDIIDHISNSPLESALRLTVLGLTPLICLKMCLFILTDIITNKWKERLVHFRWKNPLPGCRANKLIANDHRIDPNSLPPIVGQLLDEKLSPLERNARWYGNIYLPVREQLPISNTHQKYLLYRDAASGSFLLLIFLAIADIVSRNALSLPLLYKTAYLITCAYILFLMVGANNTGNRMVTGSIANFIGSTSQG